MTARRTAAPTLGGDHFIALLVYLTSCGLSLTHAKRLVLALLNHQSTRKKV